MKHSREWAFGDTVQRRWSDLLADSGRCVLPTHAFEDVTPETKAPVMLTPGGILVTPDVLTFSLKHGVAWHEVKGKSVPSFFRKTKTWEHGFDFDLVQEYRRVEDLTKAAVYVIVYETESPDCEDPACDGEVGEESKKCTTCGLPIVRDQVLAPGGRWFFMALDHAVKAGRHSPLWPGGYADPQRRGRRGKGGLLFPRASMTGYSIAKDEAA